MNLDDAIRGRRSIRKFREEPVPDSVIRELLDLAVHAPSSMNGQPWRFVVIRNKEIKKRLVELKNKSCPIEKAMYRADFLEAASAVIVVCVDRATSYEREIENAVLATANIMLAAWARGLGSVYMSAQRGNDPTLAEEVRQLLHIPANVDPVTIVPIGYPDETPEGRTLPGVERVSFVDRFTAVPVDKDP